MFDIRQFLVYIFISSLIALNLWTIYEYRKSVKYLIGKPIPRIYSVTELDQYCVYDWGQREKEKLCAIN